MSDSLPAWIETDVVPPLDRDDVHVWHLILATPSAKSWGLLSDDELTRAHLYRIARDRDRFASCRATLRCLLGVYVKESPRRLIFGYEPHGKPFLQQSARGPALHFNVSHSGDTALAAFTRGRQLGVDVECLQTPLDFQSLANRFMSPGEADYVRDAADTRRAFYTCWTRKEAWMKAIGCGLREPLSRFDTSSTLGQISATLTCLDFAPPHWALRELAPGPDLIGAVAIPGSKTRIRSFSIPPGWAGLRDEPCAQDAGGPPFARATSDLQKDGSA